MPPVTNSPGPSQSTNTDPPPIPVAPMRRGSVITGAAGEGESSPPALPTRRISVNPAILQAAGIGPGLSGTGTGTGTNQLPPPLSPPPTGILSKSPSTGKRKSVKIDLAENTVAFIDNNSTKSYLQPNMSTSPRSRGVAGLEDRGVGGGGMKDGSDRDEEDMRGLQPPAPPPPPVQGRRRSQQGAQGHVSAITRVTEENRDSLTARDSFTVSPPGSPVTQPGSPLGSPRESSSPALPLYAPMEAQRRPSVLNSGSGAGVGTPPPIPPPPPPRRTSLQTLPQKFTSASYEEPPPLPPSLPTSSRREVADSESGSDDSDQCTSVQHGTGHRGTGGSRNGHNEQVLTRRFSAVIGVNPLSGGGGPGRGPSTHRSPPRGEQREGSGSGGSEEDAQGDQSGSGGGVPPPLPLAQRVQARAKGGKLGRRMSQRDK